MSSLLQTNFLLVNVSILYLKFQYVYKKVFYADSFKGKQNLKIFGTTEGHPLFVRGTLAFVEAIFVYLEDLFTCWKIYLYFLLKSLLHFWKPALFALMKFMFILVEAGLIKNCGRLIWTCGCHICIFVRHIRTYGKKSYYTCRGFICACGTFINTWSSLICTFVSHICTCGKLICSYGSPICTCASLICTCDLYFFYNLEGLCHKQYLEFF